MKIPANTQTVFKMLERAAEEALPCPTNERIREQMGWSTTSPVRRHMARLENAGLISVNSGACSKTVTIVATGKSTAPNGQKARSPGHGKTLSTPDQDDFIRTHYKQDMTPAEIGEHLGKNKNQVIGRARILGLCKPKDNPSKPKSEQKPARLKDVAPSLKNRQALRMIVRRTSSGLRHKVCQFIEGEPSVEESCKCRKPVLPGSSYCPEHDERCWVPLKARAA